MKSHGVWDDVKREHLKDDDELITAEWLNLISTVQVVEIKAILEWEIKFQFGSLLIRWMGGPRYVPESWSIWIGDVDNPDTQSFTHQNPTRGDVRRLCVALGIELEQ